MLSMFIQRDGGRIGYDVTGTGPLVVCIPGLGDLRQEYRFLVPPLVRAGLRVATLDLRGHGESSTGFAAYGAEAIGGDALALIERLGGPAVIVGTSMAAASAVWAAAEAPSRVAGLVTIGPFVRDLPLSAAQRFALWLLLRRPWGPWAWGLLYRSLYPSARPADFPEYRRRLVRNLREPGRFEALCAMLAASKAPCEARLAEVRAPALVVMGTKDPDFPDPAAEARHVAAALRGELLLVEGAGHYPHAERPDAVAPRLADFVRAAHGAETRPHA